MRTTRCALVVDLPHEISCHPNVPRGSQKSLQIVHLWPKFYKSCEFREGGRVDAEIIGPTEKSLKYVYKNKKNNGET